MMKKLKLLIFLIVILLTSCAGKTVTGQINNTLPTETAQVPTQDPAKGIVTGKIITDNPVDRNGLIVYLGDIIIDSKGYVGGFLDKQRAPNGLVNGEDGIFTIRNVPPGKYSLIIYEVVFGGRAYTDETGNVMTINVEPGKTVDLGDINFSGY